MKKKLIFLFSFFCIQLVFAQSKLNFFGSEPDDTPDFGRDFFIDKKINKVSAYTYSFNKKGKLKKDSVLLFQHQFDANQNKLFGLMSFYVIRSHATSYRELNEFEKFYNTKGQLIKVITYKKKAKKSKRKKHLDYEVQASEIEREYDDLHREIKTTRKQLVYDYSISLPDQDTIGWLYILQPEINEFTYNSANQKTEAYKTIDSSRNYSLKEMKLTKTYCFNCFPKHLENKWKYDDNQNRTESISYTREGTQHSKINYIYDAEQRLVSRIDSSGWYITNSLPYWHSTTNIQYTPEAIIATQIFNPQYGTSFTPNRVETTYNQDNRILKKCMDDKCIHYFYDYNSNLQLIQKKQVHDDGTQESIEFQYNQHGFLIERREIKNDKLMEMIRYYYE